MGKFLVTGGEGFIGSAITNLLHKADVLHEVSTYDIKSNQNVLDTDLLKKTVAGLFPNINIFHLASRISVPESIAKPDEYYRNNVVGTESVIKVVSQILADRISGDKSDNNSFSKCSARIIFSSSASVYGDTFGVVDENSRVNPKSPYAENKRDCELLLSNACSSSIAEGGGLSSVCLRYFNVYGPGQSFEYAGVITVFIKNALLGKDLIIYGDGEQVRDFVYVEDVAEANLAAMNYAFGEMRLKNFEIFNIGSGIETSINDLAKLIIKLTNSSSIIRHEPARVGDIVYSCPNVDRARKLLNWKARVGLEEGLKKTIESLC